MAIVSRLKLDHPALGTAGGASLHAAVEALYLKIGDAIGSRWFQLTDFDNAESVDCEHDFDTDIANLRWQIYVYTGGQWVLTTDQSSPARSAFTVAETVGFEDDKLTITNVSAGNDLLVAFVISNDPLALENGDVKDVDITTTAPEDGQALVYDSASDKWKPGASGDSSFKLQSVTDPNAVIKGGYLQLDDGRELATHDGAGSASTDFGTDLTVNLDTILGSNPANATAYGLYVDLESLGAEVTQTDTGRKVFAVVEANLKLFTTMPSGTINRSRYVHLGFVRSADSGTAWSGTGSTFGTFAARKHDNGPVAVNPIVFSLAKQAVGAVGSSGQVAAGHVLSSKSWPSAMSSTARRFYNLAADSLDDSGNGTDLTNNGSTAFTATNILGAASAAATFDGVDDSFSSTNPFFNPGASSSFSFGGWFKANDWTPGSNQVLIGNQASTSDRGFYLYVETSGAIILGIATGASTETQITIPNPGFTDGTWHHFAAAHEHTTDTWKLYIDGRLVGSLVQNPRSLVSSIFRVGAFQSTPSAFFAGSAQDVFFVSGHILTDEDIRRLAAYRYDHARDVASKNQEWGAKLYTSVATQDNQQWLVDAGDKDSVFWDFSGLASTDSVELFMRDLGLSPQVIPAVPPFDATYTSNPSFPIAHGQAEVPELVLLQEIATGVWEPVIGTGHVKADATNIDGTLASLFTGGATKVRVIARSKIASASVPDATAARAGVVTTTAQTLAGAKTFNDAIKASGGFDATGGAGVATTAAYGLVKLPSSQVWATTSGTGGSSHGSTNTKIRRFTATSINAGTAITYADSATNGTSFTINEDGIYAITYSDQNGGGSASIGVSKNSASLTTNVESIGTDAVTINYSMSGNIGLVNVVLPLVAGDVIRPHTDGSPTVANAKFRIVQVLKL